MGRAPCCEKVGLRRGRWTAEEDQILSNYIQVHGEGSWRSLPKKAGLLRCGKSCRLRWINYLRSDVKRGNISPEEEDAIVKLHASLGNRWSLIAGKLAGRTDNEIKNYWNSHLRHKITTPSSTTIPTKRRSSVMKTKKPRKKTSTPSLDKQNSLNPITDSAKAGELVQDSSTFIRDKEKELEDCFFDESFLMDPSVMLPLNDTEDVIHSLISSSSSTDDGSQLVNQVDYGWDWDFDGGKSMVGFGGDEEDDIMSWPWESPTDDQLGVDAEKQEAMIAWLLS